MLKLIQAIENWTEILDNGRYVDDAYFDFTKAFCKVPDGRLVCKLQLYYIGPVYGK